MRLRVAIVLLVLTVPLAAQSVAIIADQPPTRIRDEVYARPAYEFVRLHVGSTDANRRVLVERLGYERTYWTHHARFHEDERFVIIPIRMDAREQFVEIRTEREDGSYEVRVPWQPVSGIPRVFEHRPEDVARRRAMRP